MNLHCIAEHTVDIGRLNRQSKVLDLGCRAFSWSKAMMEYVDEIYCVDADPDVLIPDKPLKLIRGAVSLFDDKLAWLHCSGNGTGNYIVPKDLKVRNQIYKEVKTITLKTINEISNCPFWDVIKFDIEGSEIGILSRISKPIADQLSIEFHLHTGTKESEVQDVFKHLESLGYVKIFQDYSEKHGCGLNYWDVLFVLPVEIKDIKLTEASVLEDGSHGIGYNFKL